ncbi:hypothetical protein HHJ49_00045 [Escherichia coli]|nr:hypothetical protein HHJ49_00045 [Escherichia coli]
MAIKRLRLMRFGCNLDLLANFQRTTGRERARRHAAVLKSELFVIKEIPEIFIADQDSGRYHLERHHWIRH